MVNEIEELALFERNKAEMYLKEPLWSETGKGDGSAKTEDYGAVSEVVKSLQQQRVYREVTLALRTGLRDARAEFSFLRVRALRSILKFLRSVAESDSTIDLFNQIQSIPQLQGLFCSVLLCILLCFWFASLTRITCCDVDTWCVTLLHDTCTRVGMAAVITPFPERWSCGVEN